MVTVAKVTAAPAKVVAGASKLKAVVFKLVDPVLKLVAATAFLVLASCANVIVPCCCLGALWSRRDCDDNTAGDTLLQGAVARRERGGTEAMISRQVGRWQLRPGEYNV